MIQSSLNNGLRYAVRSYGNAVGYCSLSIKVGTRHEEGFHSGIAHFLEHTLFKGTSHKTSAAINNTLERLGGELNAYTTKEEIVLHATVLKKDLAKAASLLLEIASDAQFPEDEIEVEKGVVIDEIASYKDFPAEEIYDLFEEKLFEGHPLSKPILGTEESVRAISSDELKRFCRKFFTADRMVLSMVSPLPEADMVKMVEKIAAKAGIPAQGTAENAQEAAAKQEAILERRHFCQSIRKDNNEVNCVMGGYAPSLEAEEERIAAILLCNMLGGPSSNSMLGSILREKHGWVYNVECNYTPYSDSGVVAISFGCDRDNLKKCTAAIHRQLAKLLSAPVSEKKLAAAKRQILGQNAIGMENGEAQCLSMGKSILCFGQVPDDEQVVSRIMSVTAEQLHKTARELFCKENINTLIFN
ncbi:MAG: insulinase family protein [Bacteroidales bacterium]|nr:insulinase family protein [Bacteroidales bacterium]